MNSSGYALVGCMVAPGFEFKDFELFERNYLLDKYPNFKEIILKLTR
jgi:predicted cupin superfamily sugar epimerase